MAENRVDPTVAGLILLGFVTLLFGIIGIQIFQGVDVVNEPIFGATMSFVGVVGFMVLIFAYMAGKAGNAFAVALFAFVAVSFLAVRLALGGDFFYQGLYIAALFYLIFAAIAQQIGAPKLLALLLFVVSLLFFFVGLFLSGFVAGDPEAPYAIAFGLFGIAAFLLSIYLAVALSTQKLPVF